MKLIKHISRILALALLLPAINTAASELESALDAALQGKPGGPFDVLAPVFELFHHRFGVRAVEVVDQQNGRYTLAGRLTRLATKGGSEDVIAYRIVKERAGGVIKTVTWQINGGEWTPLSQPMMKALGKHRPGRGRTPEQQREQKREVASALEQAVDKTWRRAAEFFIAHVAVREC